MGIFDGCLLACDIDGTLLSNDIINPRNIAAAEYFTAEGGCFALATGRTASAVGSVLEKIDCIGPSVVGNGCVIYDFKNDTSLEELYIAPEDYAGVYAVLENEPGVGIEIHAGKRVLTLRETQETLDHQLYEGMDALPVTREAAADFRWNKVLYCIDDSATLERVRRLTGGICKSSSFVGTTATIDGRTRLYYEHLPEGISKAKGVLRLAELLKIKKGCIFAMGDYYNDLEMLKAADMSAVPEGTPEDIRKYADFIGGRCEDGAVADFTDYLKNLLQNKKTDEN